MASPSDNTNAKSPIEKYPYPTKFNVLDFVPKLLGLTNYEKWNKLMRDFIERRGLIDFIDGTAQEENAKEDSDGENAEKDCDEAWQRSDNLVQAWILATLTEDIRLELRYSKTAEGLWKELSRKFDPTSLFLPRDIRLEVCNLRTAKDLWEELSKKFDPTSPFSSNNNAKSPIEKSQYPTEFNVLDFVPKLLGQANYEKWKKLMRDFIERRGLIDFIDGTAQEENANEDCDEARKRSDNLVQGWILATLTEDIRLEMLELDERTAKYLWEELSRNFDPTSSFWKSDEERENRVRRYLPLHKATIKGVWEEARGIIEYDPDAVRTRITLFDQVALHVAIRSRGRNHFVRKLLEKMTPEDVSLVDDDGDTALHSAASRGNIEGARMLVDKNRALPNVVNKNGQTALHYAASWGHREMVHYLLEVTSEDTILDL